MRRRIKTSSSGVKTEMVGAGFGVQQQAFSGAHVVKRRQDASIRVLVRGKSERETRPLPVDSFWLLLSLAFRRAASGADTRSGGLPSTLP
jgi:hypothetical protein